MIIENTTTILVLRIFLGAVLLAAGLLKIKDLNMFAIAVRTYKLLPELLIKPLSYGLVFAEIVIGITLIIGFEIYYVSLLAALMQTVTLIFVIITLLKHRSLKDCGCFGAGFKVPVTWWHVPINALFVIAALLIAFST